MGCLQAKIVLLSAYRRILTLPPISWQARVHPSGYCVWLL